MKRDDTRLAVQNVPRGGLPDFGPDALPIASAIAVLNTKTGKVDMHCAFTAELPKKNLLEVLDGLTDVIRQSREKVVL